MERYKVVKWNKFLATRERGREVRDDIELHLSRLPAGDTLVVDFSGVDGITASFADESIAKLILARASGDFADRGVVIEGSNEDVRDTLEAVLLRRKLAAVTMATAGKPEVLGDVDWLPRTLAIAVHLQSFRASELADRLGITPQAANNRLRMLVASGAVARERVVPEGGGKEFSYKAVIPTWA